MASTPKGYVTFLLALLFSYLMLLPQLSAPPPTSLAPAYAASRAWREEISFKRALQYSAADTYQLLSQDGEFSKSFQSQYLGASARASSPTGTAFDALPEAQELARTAVILRWAEVRKAWSANSDFKSSFSCHPLSVQAPTANLLREEPPICVAAVGADAACCLLLTLQTNGLYLLPEMKTQLSHSGGLSAKSEMKPGEVGP